MDRYFPTGVGSALRLAPANTEQSYRDQQKIEALAKYLSGVRANAQGLPRAEMLPRYGPDKSSSFDLPSTNQSHTESRYAAVQSTHLLSNLISTVPTPATDQVTAICADFELLNSEQSSKICRRCRAVQQPPTIQVNPFKVRKLSKLLCMPSV
jgi:hypothetical protein